MSIGKNQFEGNICMYYTTFNTISLYFNHDSYIIKIYTSFSISFFQVFKSRKITPLSNDEYKKLIYSGTKRKTVYSVSLYCKNVKKVITSFSSITI